MIEHVTYTCLVRRQQIGGRCAGPRGADAQRADTNGEARARLLAPLVDALVQPGDGARNCAQFGAGRDRAEHGLRLAWML